MLSVATVTTPLDVVDLSDGMTSLREAIFFTNILAGHDTIQFDSSLNGQTLVLNVGELAITDSLAINGPGANLLTIDASGSDFTPDTNNGDGSRIFNIDDGDDLTVIDVSVSGMTLTGGDTSLFGGAILNRESLVLDSCVVFGNSGYEGGGINSSSLNSVLSVQRSTIRDNQAVTGGGVFSISANGSVEIADSTISGNEASSQGGGLFTGANSLVITNSTFSGNTAGSLGGGIYAQPIGVGTAAQIAHSTITYNIAEGGAGILADSLTISLDHTIVAGNTRPNEARNDVAGAAAARYSFIGDNSGATITDDGGNLIGTASSPIDPALGELADNGGPTFTHALLAGSLAIDAGDPAAMAGIAGVPLNDQRGESHSRVQNGKGTGARIDIGAYEIQSGSIHGVKWNDLNGDGHWDQPDEPALESWLIYLDANTNGALDSGESWTFTDEDGSYSFSDLAPGNYLVAEVMLPGWTQTTPGGPQSTSLVVNGGFESGNFSGWTASPGFVINNGAIDPSSPDGPLPPFEGSFSTFWNGGGGLRDVYQTVALPAGQPLTLHWAHRIRNHHSAFIDNIQEARVEIRNPANQVLATIFSTNPGETLLQAWTQHSADLSAFAGQTVRIAFVVVANNFYLNLHVDDVRISAGGVGVIPVTVAEGEVVNDVDFGNWIEPPGEIRGAKWNDLNGNGIWEQSNEPGLQGWTIYLDGNENGALDSGEIWTTTGPDGSYSFTGLPAGDYLVTELVQPGWVQTSPAPFDTSSLIVNGGFETGTFSGWTLQSTGAFVINNGSFDPIGPDGPLPPYLGASSAFSNANTGTYAIYQDVAIPAGRELTLQWADRIRNLSTAFFDPSQEYRVEIRSTSNQVLQTLFSTNPGDPLIREWTERSADLSAYAGQTIRIAFVKQSNSSYLNIHFDNVRITNPQEVEPIPVTIAPGQIVSDINFGNRIVPPAEIHGFKWNDLDGDGDWDQPDEPGLEGWIIFLDANSNGALDFGETWTTTGADGSYSFAGLTAGEYVVAEVANPGWTQTYPEGNAAVGNQRLFSLRGTGESMRIYELDPATGAAINNFAAPVNGLAGPQGLALGPNSLFFIEGSSSSTHTLWELNPNTGAVIDSDVIDSSLTGPIAGLAYLNGKVYVEKYDTNRILVWDPVADMLVTTLNVSADLIGGLTGAGNLGVLFGINSNGSVFKIDPTSGAILASMNPGVGSLTGGVAYVNGELIVAHSTGTSTAHRLNPNTGAPLGTLTLAGTGNISGLAGDGTFAVPGGGVHFVTLATSEVVNDINFGNWIEPLVEIHGTKWHDLNGDGVWDQQEEPGLEGWIVFLDANRNGALDSDETWTTTGLNGSYSFTDLPAGEYIVAELMQPGWMPTHPNEVHPQFERLFSVRGVGITLTIYELNPATGAVLNSFSAPTTGSPSLLGLAAGPGSLFYIDGNNSGTHTLYELNPNTGAVIDSDIVDATLTGTIDGLAYLNGKVYVQKPTLDRILVWDPITDTLVTTLTVAADLNGGLTGAADLGLLFSSRGSGGISAIDPLTGAVFATWTPNLSGPVGMAYARGELLSVRFGTSGTVTRIDPVTGQILGTFTSGGTGNVSGLGGDGVTSVSPHVHFLETVPGQIRTDINFGNRIASLAEIHGTKWNDLDGDGVWDQPDEPGLAGWTIYFDSNGNGVLDSGETSTVTGPDGSYSFTGLAPGPYNIAEVLQPGWVQTFALPYVSLHVGENAANVNFGNRELPGSIRGQKWNDLDGDGLKETGEPGLADWTIFIDDNTNGVLDDGERWDLTDSDGGYAFLEVPTGSHVLAEVQQPGWAATFTPPIVVVTADLDVMNVDFGNRMLPGSIHGQKWNDLDGDGVKEDGEPGLPGWTIFIDQNANGDLDDGELFTITDADGNYEFTGLEPGGYTVVEDNLAGWQQTSPTATEIGQLLNGLDANNAAITALVPNRFDFDGGDTGNFIDDGGNDMYDGGNFLNTNLANGILYTNGVETPSDEGFGAGSHYFTAKYPGLFVLAATGISIDSFSITGNNGADGSGTVDTDVLSATVNGQQYTIFLKRVYNAGDPSINHIIIVRGDGAGVSHSFASDTNDDLHTVTGLSAVDEVYYVLVSTAGGEFLANAHVLNIANAFLENVGPAGAAPHRVTIGPGQNVTGVDFGNISLPLLLGDYNRDGAVNSGDYIVWRKALGAVVTPYESADGNGNSIVDADDFNVWQAHFGDTLSLMSASGSATSLPAVVELPPVSSAAVVAAAEAVVLKVEPVQFAQVQPEPVSSAARPIKRARDIALAAFDPRLPPSVPRGPAKLRQLPAVRNIESGVQSRRQELLIDRLAFVRRDQSTLEFGTKLRWRDSLAEENERSLGDALDIAFANLENSSRP